MFFYDQAYKTMSRLHDATKGGFKRPLYTKLTPEAFGKAFSCFCARTYWKETLEFNNDIFCNYMEKAIGELNSEQYKVPAKDYLRDLVDNLCIMYREGGKYYFIHRSFQEYFTALYFSYAYDSKLEKFGDFVESSKIRSGQDKTFDMLYEMIPEKVEKFIFMPFLERIIKRFNEDERGAYWGFLSILYPVIYVDVGEVGENRNNEPSFFLYSKIIEKNNIKCELDTGYPWPSKLLSQHFYGDEWVYAYSDYSTDYGFRYSLEAMDGYVPEEPDCDMELVLESSLPLEYSSHFGSPDVKGISYELEVNELYDDSIKIKECNVLINYINQEDFPLKKEFNNLMKYYETLKKRISEQDASDSLFDD